MSDIVNLVVGLAVGAIIVIAVMLVSAWIRKGNQETAEQGILFVILGKFRDVRTSAIVFALILMILGFPIITMIALLLRDPLIITSIANDSALVVAVIGMLIAPLSGLFTALGMVIQKLSDDGTPPPPTMTEEGAIEFAKILAKEIREES